MYTVIKEQCSPIFGSFDWFRIISDNGFEFQAYLNKNTANNVCEKLNLQKRLTYEEKAIIRARAEQKRLQKIVDKMNHS